MMEELLDDQYIDQHINDRDEAIKIALSKHKLDTIYSIIIYEIEGFEHIGLFNNLELAFDVVDKIFESHFNYQMKCYEATQEFIIKHPDFVDSHSYEWSYYERPNRQQVYYSYSPSSNYHLFYLYNSEIDDSNKIPYQRICITTEKINEYKIESNIFTTDSDNNIAMYQDQFTDYLDELD